MAVMGMWLGYSGRPGAAPRAHITVLGPSRYRSTGDDDTLFERLSIIAAGRPTAGGTASLA